MEPEKRVPHPELMGMIYMQIIIDLYIMYIYKYIYIYIINYVYTYIYILYIRIYCIYTVYIYTVWQSKKETWLTNKKNMVYPEFRMPSLLSFRSMMKLQTWEIWRNSI